MKLFFLLISAITFNVAQAGEDSGRGLTCKALSPSSEILKCSDGKYYAPTGETLSYSDNTSIIDAKRDSKSRIDSYKPNQETRFSTSAISK